jgi:hypothetical protein
MPFGMMAENKDKTNPKRLATISIWGIEKRHCGFLLRSQSMFIRKTGLP